MFKMLIDKPVELSGNDEKGYTIIVNSKRAIILKLRETQILLRRGICSITPTIDIKKEGILKEIEKVLSKKKGWRMCFPSGEYVDFTIKEIKYLKKLLTEIE